MVLELEHDKIKGLSEAEVLKRIKLEGYNELEGSKKHNFIFTIFDVLKEPMFILLIACGFLYVFLGDIKEALMLLFFVFVMIGISIYQENKTEKTLDRLRDLAQERL